MQDNKKRPMKIGDLEVEYGMPHEVRHGLLAAGGYHESVFDPFYALQSTGSVEMYPGAGLGHLIARFRRELEALEGWHLGDEQVRIDCEEMRAALEWLEGIDAQMTAEEER